MAGENTNTSPVVVDEEYKSAIQPVVDNNMRTDILGPHFCRVLKDYTPAREDIVSLTTKEVCKDPDLRKAIKGVIDERNNETKMKLFEQAKGAVGTILIGLVIWGIQQYIQNQTEDIPTGNTIQETSNTTKR